jgi:putative ABC transport system permease protein
VCIVSEAFVRQHLSGRTAIGTQLALRQSPRAEPEIREIVGVARQVKGRPDETEEFLQIYVPMTQLIIDDVLLVVRAASDRPETLATSVRGAIARVDKAQLVSVRDVRTLDGIAAESTARHRFRAVLVVAFAALALLLAMVGVFGTLAYSVQQRVREFGLRIALGATAGTVWRLVVGGALRVIAAGVAIGLVLAALTSRLLTSMLFGVEPLDAATFVGVTALLALTAICSTVGPALRAIRVDPAATLRGE